MWLWIAARLSCSSQSGYGQVQLAWTAVSYQILAAIWSCQVQAAKSAWICVAIELNWHFQLQPDHDQVQLGQTAVSSKILATTTAVYNKIKAYNNLTSIKISWKILKQS